MRRTRRHWRPSLRRRLLGFLLIPMALLLVVDAVLTYGVALSYANRVHDRDLGNDALTLAAMLGDRGLGSTLTPQARFLLEYDPYGRDYFSIRSTRQGVLAGNRELAGMDATPAPGAPAQLHDLRLGKRSLRAATVAIAAIDPAQGELVITVAETLRDRHAQAREILALATVMQALLLVAVLLLVWFGVSRGLRVLEPLTARLAARTNELAPIGGADVPREILPLTRTIDALFERLRATLALHDRFIADAAHQLRTPLAGLGLHVDRALADPRPETVADALGHIRALGQRAARTSSQLLTLTRAQTPDTGAAAHRALDLAQIIPEAVALRVHDALAAGVDLGYQAPAAAPVWIAGDPAQVLDLLDNLIDNSLRYAGRGSAVTVSLRRAPDGGAVLGVEDDGPGVPPSLLPRLSERFFRVPGTNAEGSGLGLAIVKSIATRHGAEVSFRLAEDHGLCVDVAFPPAAAA